MSLRQKLLLLFSLTVAAAVAAVAWTVLVRIRQVFEQRDQEETALFVSQFQREFQHRSAEVAAAVDHLAASERVRAMAFQLTQSADASPYLTEAQTMAQDAQLNFLEIVGPDGNVVSSAQWPARFGYPEPAAMNEGQAPFLKREELPDGTTALGLFAVRSIRRRRERGAAGGRPTARSEFSCRSASRPRHDRRPLQRSRSRSGLGSQTRTQPPSDHSIPAAWSAPTATYPARRATKFDQCRPQQRQPSSGIVYLTDRREDSLNATAIPLKNDAGDVMAVLTVAISRSGMVEAQQHIRAIAYGVAAGGILLAIVFSLWIAARVSRPIEQLARAAEEVAGGNWDARVPEPARPRTRWTLLARSFNHMTGATGQPARAAGAERARSRVARVGAAAGARTQESALPAATDGRESGAGARTARRGVR